MTLTLSATSPDTAISNEEIKVRRLDIGYSDDIPEFWVDNNPFLTMLFLAFSVTFPGGERFFINSVRHYQNRIEDPALKAQIRGFIGQEANHMREHIAMNAFMDQKGYSAKSMEDFVEKELARLQKKWSPEESLARTVALEHFTAIMAGANLDNPDEFERMDPRMAKLWAWHAIEETEHKAVAFDVYKSQVDNEWLRIRAMVSMSILFIASTTVRTLILLYQSGHLFNLKAWISGNYLLWGRPGVFRKIIPRYLDFFRKDFHPWQQDNREQLEKMKARYLNR